MVTVERITEQHLADWIDMMLLLWDDNSYEVLKTEHVEIINGKNYGNFICYDGDVSIGFINMSLRSDYVPGSTKAPTGYIEGLYVKTDYRKQGVAKRLVDAGKAWAKEKGCVQLGSDCQLDNHMSSSFHNNMGFTEVEKIICFIKNI